MAKHSTAKKKSDQLLVRNLGPLKQRLRRRAEQNGHSMEQEARNILRDALKDRRQPEKGLGTRIAERFRGIELDEDIPELRGYTIEVPDFAK
jgi:plasmid stability protein